MYASCYIQYTIVCKLQNLRWGYRQGIVGYFQSQRELLRGQKLARV